METERLRPGAGGRFLVGVADHDGRVDVQDQAVDRLAGDGGLGQVAADLGVLGPGDFAGLGSGGPQLGQCRGVELR